MPIANCFVCCMNPFRLKRRRQSRPHCHSVASVRGSSQASIDDPWVDDIIVCHTPNHQLGHHQLAIVYWSSRNKRSSNGTDTCAINYFPPFKKSNKSAKWLLDQKWFVE